MHLFATTGERVLVIGAGGALGSLTADVFENAGWEVTRAGRSAGGHADQNDNWLRVDLDHPERIAPALAEVDVVVNTVPHAGLAPERFVLEHGGVVLNTSALSTADTRSLGEDDAAGTVVLGAGIAPGLTNLVAADLLARHPEADELELVFTFSVAATSGPAGHEFVHRHLTATPRHETVEVPLASPLGSRECLGFAERERGWIGKLAGTRMVRSYACFCESEMHDLLLARNRRGAIAELPQPGVRRHDATTRRNATTPRAVSSEPVAHWICVRHGGERTAARTIRCSGDYLGAAHATLALAQTLQDERARAHLPLGVFGPEELVELRQLAPYLATAGIAIVDSSVTKA